MSCVRVRAQGDARRRPGFVCTDDSPLVVPFSDCPNVVQHEPWPTGYVAASAHADLMMETHEQSQCPDCERWVIWTPKTASEVSA